MSLRTRKHFLLAVLAAALAFVSVRLASAQQVTYYTFDSAVGNNSYGCYDPLVDTSATAPNPLLCFNDYFGSFGSGSNPSLNGSPGSMFLLMNPAAAQQSESVWFSVPQQVANGFTSYFSFALTPGGAEGGADGIAFVIQNAKGGGAVDSTTSCQEYNAANFGSVPVPLVTSNYPPYVPNSGPNVVAGGVTSGTTHETLANQGGCIGYSGIDNSLAVEFDTYPDSWDIFGTDPLANGNHIAIQNCGSGVNSASHESGNAGCLVINDDTSSENTAFNDSVAVPPLASGPTPTPHQAVVEYSGAQGNPANELQVYIDPPFVTGTHTPCTATDAATANQAATGCLKAASPVIDVIYNLASHLHLLNPNNMPTPDSAYVGFTGATGGSDETQQINSWTYTPHTVVTQQQPLQPADTPTTFPFGNHTYAVTYETGNTSNVEMVVSAITISPTDFEALVAGTSFTGSECQMYDGTGGNCIVYSASCFQLPLSNPPTPVACPPTDDPSTPGIDIKTAFENSIQPMTPGFIQGDPLLSPITSISGDGTTATVTCTGECATTVGQTVRILSNADNGFNVSAVVEATPAVNSFTFASSDRSTNQAGGFVTSNNLQNIFVSYTPQTIDGTVTGHSKSFSGFVATSVTAQGPAFISPPSATFTGGLLGTFTVSASGIPSPSLSRGGVTLPSGLTFVDNHDGTGTLSGTPAAGTANTYAITFTAHNTAGADAVQPFTLTVLPPVLTSIAVTPSGPTIAAGQTEPFTATGTYGDGTMQTLTNVTWASSNTSAASISVNGGVATGLAIGTTNITATSQGVLSPPVLLTVTAPVVVSIAVTPMSASINASQTQPFTAMGTYSNHTTQNLTSNVTWASTNTSAATIVAGGVATGVAPGSTNITATLGTVASPPAMLTVTSQLSVLPGSLPFGTVDLTSRTDLNLAVKNAGTTSLKITNIYFNYGPGSGKDYGYFTQCGGTLKAGQSCSIRVELFAQDLGPGAAVLGIAYNLAGSPVLVNLSGTVINPKAKLSASQLSFGMQKENTSSTKTVILTSIGSTPLLIQNVIVSGSTDFTTSTCSPASLAVNASCTITVTFDPSAKTTRSGTLTITDNALSSPQTVSLSGKGN